MNKNITAVVFTLACALFGFNANAGLITVAVDTDQINIDESVSISISAQNFEETDGFFFDFLFDDTLLNYNNNSLTSDLFIYDGLDPFWGLSVAEFSGGLGFDFQTDFFTPVEGDFNIASFTLTGISAGTSLFELTDFFSYGASFDYDVEYTTFSSVTVNSTSVPEPSSVVLMLLAGIALVNGRRKI
jgi:hypothetical protein